MNMWNSLFLYYLLIIVLFSIWTTVNLLLFLSVFNLWLLNFTYAIILLRKDPI